MPYTPHPQLLKQLIGTKRPDRLNKELYKSINRLFHQPQTYSTLATLSYAKLLRYTIPPIKKVVDLPQFDGYHAYAVDTHSLRCVYYLENIDDNFILSLWEALGSDEKMMLKLAVFLHDAGKGRRRDHHYVSASLFKIFAKKLNIKESLIKLGEILILHHTLMSKVAQREDIYNETVVLSFASHFKTQKLLDMIYILTYADMSGVGNDIYNNFSAKLLRTLYKQSQEALKQTHRLSEASKRSKKIASLKRHKSFKSLTRTEQNKILSIPSNLLFLRYSSERILAISNKAFETKSYNYSISNKSHLTIEIIRKGDFNLSYLLYKLASLHLVNMDICKLFDGLKYFKMDFLERIDLDEIVFLEELIAQSFIEQNSYNKLDIHIDRDEIEIDCNHSKNYGIMHINTKDQRGLIAYTIDIFDSMGIDIVTAKIYTIKNRARDMFLIEKNGNFCHNTEKIIEKLTRKL
jgi:[protein-PII] uridylyltransferase